MNENINFFFEDITKPSLDFKRIKTWLSSLIKAYNYELIEINYILCSDKYILDVNQEYLKNKNNCDSKPGQLPDFHTVCRYDKRCGGCYLNNSCGVGVKNEGLAPN